MHRVVPRRGTRQQKDIGARKAPIPFKYFQMGGRIVNAFVLGDIIQQEIICHDGIVNKDTARTILLIIFELRFGSC